MNRLYKALLKGRSPQRQYIYNLNKIFSKYSINRSEISVDLVDKYLEENNELVNPSMVEKITNQLIRVHNMQMMDVYNEIYQEVTKLYKYQKSRKIKIPVKEKSTVSYSLEDYDIAAIRILTDGQLLWIKEHVPQNQVITDIQEVLREAQLHNLTADQTVGVLRTFFAQYTPEKYLKRFGEESYWEGFNRNQATVTRNFADISRMETAGAEWYRIYVRMTERTCAYCAQFHLREYKVSDARENLNAYMDAVENQDIEAMKEAGFWGKNTSKPPPESDLNRKGVMTPFHWLCECYLEYFTK